MWIFTKKRGTVNLDLFDTFGYDGNYTYVRKTGQASTIISENDVTEKIRTAIRVGAACVEVE